MRLKHFLTVFLTLLTFSIGQVWGASPATSNSFSSTSGNIGNDANISYSMGQGSATTNSEISSSQIKLYRSTGDNSGGVLLLTANNGVKITKINVTFTGTLGYRNASDLNSSARTNYTSLTSGSDASISNWSYVQISNIVAKNTKTQAFISAITVTYSSGAASYNVAWTINPAAGGTLSATSGTSISVTPNAAYTYGDPAYTVTSGSATVSQSTNTFTATPNANCTIRINMVEKPKYTITYDAGSGSCATSTWTQTMAGQSTTLPIATTTCTGWTFAGWCTSAAGSSETNTTSPSDILTGSYTPTGNVTLHAVYTKTEGTPVAYTKVTSISAGTYVMVSKHKDSQNYMYMPNTTSSGSNPALGSGITMSTTAGVTTLTNEVTNAMLWDFTTGATSGKFYVRPHGSTTIGLGTTSSNGTNIRISDTYKNTEWSFSTSNSYGWTITNGSKYLAVYADNAWRNYGDATTNQNGTFYLFKQSGGSTTYYMSSLVCCSSLGSINGSVNETHPTSVVLKWDENSNYENWAVTGSGTIGEIKTTTISNVEYLTCEVTGLSCNTEYEFTVTADPVNNSGYCDGSWKISGTTGKYSISVADGITNGTIVADKTTACAGETVTLTPVSEDGYHFASWSLNGTAQDVNTLTFTMPEGNATISGAFEENNVPMVINITSTDKATVTSSVTSALANTNITLSCTDIDEGYQFFGWIVTAGGNPVVVTNPTSATGASFTMPAAVVTVTADIRQMVTVTFKCNNVTCGTQSTYVGGTVTFPSDPTKFDNDYPNFIGWAEAIEGIATSAPTLKSASDAITENVDYHAVFSSTPVATGNYAKITTLDDLESGVNYVIAVNNSGDYALQAEKYSDQYYYYMKAASVTVTNDEISNPASDIIWDVTKNSNGKVYIKNGNNYLYITYTGQYTNLKLATSIDNENEEWYTPSFTNGVLTLTSQQHTNYQLAYATGSNFKEYKAGTSTTGSLYIYKQQYSQEFVTRQIVKHTISYDANTTDPYTGTLPNNVSVVKGEDYTVSTATLSRAGYNFIGWNISNTATTAQTTIENVTADATLYAVWEAIPTYNIEFSVNGSVEEGLTLNLEEGASITFPKATVPEGSDKKFVGWIEDETIADPAVAPSFVTSATVGNAGKTYYAVFADVTEGDYEKLTSATGLAAGDKLVATDGEAVGMKAWDGEKNNCQGATITIANNKITTLGDAAELILGGESGHWTLYDGEYYLYAAGTSTSGSNHMKGKTQKDNACEWTISISSGDATIQSVTNSKTPYMRYNPNNGNPIFSCYSSSSSQNAVVLFKKAVTVADFVTTVAPLDHIAISGDFQTTYKKGTTLNLEGMVVTATYGTGGDARNRVLASDAYTVDLVGEELVTTDDEFVVSFGGKTATQAIHVYALSGIEITSAPTKTTYKAGETFVPEGLKIQATWGGDATDKIEESNIATGFTYSPTTAFENETDENINVDVTITYTSAGISQTAVQAVTVEPLAHLVMTWNVAGETTTSKIYINNQDKYLLALPAEDPEVPEAFGTGYEFIGWTNAGSVERDGSDFTKAVADVEIDENATEAERTYHAVFAQVNAPFFKETFDKCGGTGGNDGSWSGSIATSTVNTDNTGWINVSAGGAERCIKLGATSTKGSAQTPSFSLTGSATLTFKAGAWNGNSEGTTLNISATGATLKQNNVAISSVTLTKGAWTTYTVGVTDATGTVTIKFEAANASNNRFFLDEVEVKNGDAEYSNYRFMPSSVTTPVIGLAEATYYGAQDVTITQAQEKQIFYSLDGNTWTEYTEPVALNQAGSVTLYAKAYDESEDDYSSVVSKSYTIVTSIADPEITPSKAFYGGSMEVEISHELSGTEGFTLQYSYDGENYVDYTTALTITEDKTVYAKATIGSLEAIVNANYTVGRFITYWRVTNANQLRAGQRAIIAQYVSADETVTVKVMDAQSGNNCNAKASTATNNGAIITPAFVAYSITLEDAGDGKFAFKVPGGYLYAASSSSNHLKLRETNDNADGKWKIEISNTAVATITAQGTATHNSLKYNSSNDLFSCYENGQTAVAIYVNEICTDINVSALEDNADVTVGKDATLTIDEEKTLNDIIVKSGAMVTVDEQLVANDMIVEAGGTVALSSNKLTVVGTFAIETSMATQNQHKSGQLTGVTALNFAANGPAYIDITLGANGTNQQWHAFTVPFPVDVMSGIYDLDGNKLTNEVNYAIMDYHGDIRATGQYGWKKIRTTLVPGTFYLMTVDGERTTYRFKKKAGEPLVAENSKPICEYPLDGGGTGDNGWNGIGNPTLKYGKVNAVAYVLDPESYTYQDKDENSTNFVVGTPFFVVATADGSISMLSADADANYAPRRMQAKGVENIKVSFGNETYTDYLTISASEDALSTYETGKDYLKMTMTSTPSVAQIFGKAYGVELCRVFAPMSNDQAIYDLKLYAPQAGEYVISAPSMDNADLYLTYEGSIIWNLSMGEYMVDLNKGTTNGYGLLLVAQPNQMPTGLDTTEGVAGDAVQKILLNGQLYILRDGHLFDAVGHEMK